MYVLWFTPKNHVWVIFAFLVYAFVGTTCTLVKEIHDCDITLVLTYMAGYCCTCIITTVFVIENSKERFVWGGGWGEWESVSVLCWLHYWSLTIQVLVEVAVTICNSINGDILQLQNTLALCGFLVILSDLPMRALSDNLVWWAMCIQN